MRLRGLAAWVVTAALAGAPPPRKKPEPPPAGPDVIVVGAGVAGLAAAVEAALRGARVNLVDQSTVPGGAAIHTQPERVMALYRQALARPEIRWLRAHRLERLLINSGAVEGVDVRNLRREGHVQLRAPATVLATGGFASNLSILKSNLPASLAPDTRLLLGGAWGARGQGLELALLTGAAVTGMDQLWLRAEGANDPRDAEGDRGLVAPVPNALYVNNAGEAVGGDAGSPTIEVLLAQPAQQLWALFDAEAREGFLQSLRAPAERYSMGILLNVGQGEVKQADRLDRLAAMVQLPLDQLNVTVEEHNRKRPEGARLEAAPFYAVQLQPVVIATRGGLKVDERGHVLRSDGNAVPGLFAAGEIVGTTEADAVEAAGRLAGRAAAEHIREVAIVKPAARASAPAQAPYPRPCFRCHDVRTEVLLRRDGWWHYQRSHALVQDMNMTCGTCHSALPAATDAGHHHQPADLLASCLICHQGSGAK